MIFLLWPNFPNGETEAQRGEVVFLMELVADPATDQKNDRARWEVGRVRGHPWGPGAQVFCSAPGNTPAQESHWWPRGGSCIAGCSQNPVWLGPILLGWGQIQATEMTILQPLSAVSILHPLQPHPSHASHTTPALPAPAAFQLTLRSSHTACQRALVPPPGAVSLWKRHATRQVQI